MRLHDCLLRKRLFSFVAAGVWLLAASADAVIAYDEGNSQSATGAANPVTINFDTLQTNIVLPSS